MNGIIIGTVIALGAIVPISAADAGIGLSVKANDYAIYIPYKASDRIQVEGVLHFAHQNGQGQLTGMVPEDSHSSNTSATAGLGIFWLQPMGEKGRVYLGPRVTYIRNEFMARTPVYSFSNKGDGYAIAPTIGYEYFPVKNVSIGGEVGLEFGRYKQINNQTFNGPDIGDATSHTSSSQTTSALILRLYF